MKQTYTIGFDIGGTYLRGARFSGRRAVQSVVRKTPRTKKAFARALQDALKKLTPPSGSLRGVGIGIAGVVSGTKLLKSPNLKPLAGLDLRNVIPRNLKLKVDNDARCFLRGQPNLKTRYRARRVLGVTLGTGVGRALAVNGQVKPIKRFEYAEAWEPQYQQQRFKASKELATYLAQHLAKLVKLYHADVVILGGGVVTEKPTLKHKLKAHLSALDLGVTITYTVSKPSPAALGAALTLS